MPSSNPIPSSSKNALRRTPYPSPLPIHACHAAQPESLVNPRQAGGPGLPCSPLARHPRPTHLPSVLNARLHASGMRIAPHTHHSARLSSAWAATFNFQVRNLGSFRPACTSLPIQPPPTHLTPRKKPRLRKGSQHIPYPAAALSTAESIHCKLLQVRLIALPSKCSRVEASNRYFPSKGLLRTPCPGMNDVANLAESFACWLRIRAVWNAWMEPNNCGPERLPPPSAMVGKINGQMPPQTAPHRCSKSFSKFLIFHWMGCSANSRIIELNRVLISKSASPRGILASVPATRVFRRQQQYRIPVSAVGRTVSGEVVRTGP